MTDTPEFSILIGGENYRYSETCIACLARLTESVRIYVSYVELITTRATVPKCIGTGLTVCVFCFPPVSSSLLSFSRREQRHLFLSTVRVAKKTSQ